MNLPYRQAFTLLEMLTTIAALVIVLGLMVLVARHVRQRSAETQTRQLLMVLEQQIVPYHSQYPSLEEIPPLVDDGQLSEDALQEAALRNSRAFVRAWVSSAGDKALQHQPLSLYDRATLRDAWGTPVVYMPPGSRNIAVAPLGRAFFLSAGPDRQFSTVLDNLYSYEPGLP